jgi:hypothetical protein
MAPPPPHTPHAPLHDHEHVVQCCLRHSLLSDADITAPDVQDTTRVGCRGRGSELQQVRIRQLVLLLLPPPPPFPLPPQAVQ